MALADTANLVVQLRLDDKLSPGLGRVGGSLSKFQAGIGQMSRGIGQVSSGLDRLATRAAVGAGVALAGVVTTAASFEQAFTGVEKTVDGTDAQLAELEATIRQMARTMPVSFEELASIGAAGGALGVARESLDEFIDVVARLSVSTNLDADTAATALGQLGTVLHLTGQDYEDFADSLVALGNKGASTESQIVDLAARFAAAGNSAGLSKEEILAISSAVASMGVEVEAGGTALSQTFNGITQAIGTGSDEVKAYTSTLGISAKEFKKRWTEDALGTFTAFLTELSKLDKYKQADVLAKAGITGTRQVTAVMLMTQNLGFFADQLDVANTAQGALDKESQKFFDTSAGQWKILQGNVRDAAATIGAELLPVANSLISDFVEKLQEPGTQSMLKNLGKDIAFGVKNLVAELKGTDFSGIIGGMKLAAQVAKGAFDAFRSLPEPIQQLAIAALVANKVSGGAVGMIAKGLGNLLLGSLKTITAANVTVVGGTVTGGGVGGVAGKGGASLLQRVFLAGIAVEAGFLLGSAISNALVEAGVGGIKPAKEFEEGVFANTVNSGDVERIVSGINNIDEQLSPSLLDLGLSLEDSGAAIALALDIGGVRTTLESQRQVLLDQLQEMGLTRAEAEKLVAEQRAQVAKYGEEAVRQISAVQSLHLPLGIGNALLQQIREKGEASVQEQRIATALQSRWGGKLDLIADKNPVIYTNVKLTSNVSVSVSNVVRTITSYTAALGSGPGGAVSNPY